MFQHMNQCTATYRFPCTSSDVRDFDVAMGIAGYIAQAMALWSFGAVLYNFSLSHKNPRQYIDCVCIVSSTRLEC